ncbi:hypothetical protein HK104_001810 [Borealophlyctis nickersoniae]|nr:hypothetical protein HK104_001810 [Borealophlyctis nickersoniae]
MAALRSETLSTFRGILREISKQYTRVNNNRVWHKTAVDAFRTGANSTGDAAERALADAKDVLTYMRSSRVHREMMEQYWPTKGLSQEELLRRTANTVGLSLPKTVEGGAGVEDLFRGSRGVGLSNGVQDVDIPPAMEEAFKIVAGAGEKDK